MIKFALRLIIVFATLFSANAQNDLPEPMNPPRMVNDFAGIFTPAQNNDLENILRAYHDSTTTQIYVVSVNTLNGDAPYNYAAQLGEKWGIGQKGKDNGVLILIKPKNDDARGQVYIATGYGVEARLTDAIAGRIINEYMIPHLQSNNDYYTATKEAVFAIIRQLSGEFSSDNNNAQTQPKTFAEEVIDNIIGFFMCCCILPVFIFLMIYSKNFRRLMLFFLFFGRGGGGGGRSGGGFGGGGGGRFGGGGAGRSW